MKKSEYQEAIGILMCVGRNDLVEAFTSPLCDIPKPKRRELDEQGKQEKRTKENTRYHQMSPADKEKKAKESNEKRDQRNRAGNSTRAAIELMSGNLI